MNKQYIISIDQGSSAIKAIVIDEEGRIIAKTNIKHSILHPYLGWVEYNPEEIYRNTIEALKTVVSKSEINKSLIKCISVTNQRETIVAWDRKTGKPIYNAISWQCNRGLNLADRLKEEGWEKLLKEKTGLHISCYFSAVKIAWLFENVINDNNNDICIGTMDSWLIWNLTKGKSHVTDYSNASRTQLLNINTLKWDVDLLEIFDIPKKVLPKLKYSDEIFGETNIENFLDKKIPITGVMGDSHAALFGQNCFEIGSGKATLGTGSSIMVNVGRKPLKINNTILTTIAWGAENEVEYAFEGNITSAGDTVNWMINQLGILPNAEVSEEYAEKAKDSNGVYLVPAFLGLGAPYWENKATASIIGMTRNTDKYNIVRAGLESIAYQIKDVLVSMEENAGIEILNLKVDGGATKNKFLMQFLADITGVPIIKNDVEELSALGAAYMAGLALKFWDDKTKLKSFREKDIIFYPKMAKNRAKELYDGWKFAVEKNFYGI